MELTIAETDISIQYLQQLLADNKCRSSVMWTRGSTTMQWSSVSYKFNRFKGCKSKSWTCHERIFKTLW